MLPPLFPRFLGLSAPPRCFRGALGIPQKSKSPALPFHDNCRLHLRWGPWGHGGSFS